MDSLIRKFRGIPTHIGKRSMGGWVVGMQQQVHNDRSRLDVDVPDISGQHTGDWVDLVNQLCEHWGLEQSGDIHPAFLTAYEDRIGSQLIDPMSYPTGPSIITSPEDERGAQWSFGAHCQYGDDTKLTLARFGQRFRPSGSGGDGGSVLCPEWTEDMNRVADIAQEQNAQVLLMDDGRVAHMHHHVSEWGSVCRKRSVLEPIRVDMTSIQPQEPSAWLRLMCVTKQPLVVVLSDYARRQTGY